MRNSLASARAISPAASRIASYGRSIARGVVSVLSVLLAAGTVACSAAPAATQPLPPAHATSQPTPPPATAEPATTPPVTEELAAEAAVGAHRPVILDVQLRPLAVELRLGDVSRIRALGLSRGKRAGRSASPPRRHND